MSLSWPQVRLGDVLVERRESPGSAELVSGDVRIVGKIRFDVGSIEFRSSGDTRTGMILIRPGDLLVSGINAAKGAVAIYSDSEGRAAAATIHYGAYEVDVDRADSKYLWWFMRSASFREVLAQHLPGGIKTELKAKRLLPVPIRLPSLQEQHRIVARIETIAGKVVEAKKLRGEADEGRHAVVSAALNSLAGKISVDGVLAGVLLEPPRNGWSAPCDNMEGGVAVLALSAVTGFRYRQAEYKRTSVAVRADAHYWLAAGDLLITRSNSPELVGHAAIYNGSPNPCIYPDLMMRLRVNRDFADTKFVWYWLQGRMVRNFIRMQSKGTSPTMKKISQGVVSSIPFPKSLSRDEQTELVRKFDLMEAEMGSLADAVIETTTALDAVLPAVLDKAFRGEM